MAGDWIAWQTGLTRKPEVIRIAAALKVSRREAAAYCMEVWEWWDQNSSDGFIEGLTAQHLSDAVGIEGVGEAMLDVAWLLQDDAGLHMPNWQRWNLKSGKRRLQDTALKQSRRSVAND